MDHCNLYTDIATRTGGDIYIGVVGPVRTGKSTFIKRFMELMVLPEIQSEAFSQRARDELPQSAAGRTIMTTTDYIWLFVLQSYPMPCRLQHPSVFLRWL